MHRPFGLSCCLRNLHCPFLSRCQRDLHCTFLSRCLRDVHSPFPQSLPTGLATLSLPQSLPTRLALSLPQSVLPTRLAPSLPQSLPTRLALYLPQSLLTGCAQSLPSVVAYETCTVPSSVSVAYETCTVPSSVVANETCTVPSSLSLLTGCAQSLPPVVACGTCHTVPSSVFAHETCTVPCSVVSTYGCCRSTVAVVVHLLSSPQPPSSAPASSPAFLTPPQTTPLSLLIMPQLISTGSSMLWASLLLISAEFPSALSPPPPSGLLDPLSVAGFRSKVPFLCRSHFLCTYVSSFRGYFQFLSHPPKSVLSFSVVAMITLHPFRALKRW